MLIEGEGAGGKIMFLNTANGATAAHLQHEEHGAG